MLLNEAANQRQLLRDPRRAAGLLDGEPGAAFFGPKRDFQRARCVAVFDMPMDTATVLFERSAQRDPERGGRDRFFDGPLDCGGSSALWKRHLKVLHGGRVYSDPMRRKIGRCGNAIAGGMFLIGRMPGLARGGSHLVSTE
ncbi:MAG TPA: hypothetical protein VH518_20350 [Tepidisphaeraceae bacterium]